MSLRKQILRFGSVGVVATLTHLGVFSLAHYLGGVPPLAANLIGFLAASGVTYWGNQRWTFEGRSSHAQSALRFPVMAGASLAASTTVTWLATSVLNWGVLGALVLVALTVPAMSFLIARLWVFRPN